MKHTPWLSTAFDASASNTTNTQYAYATQEKDAGTADKFAARDHIGAKITTDGSWAAGSTPSVVATIWVQRFLSET